MRTIRMSVAAMAGTLCTTVAGPALAQDCIGVRITTQEGPRALIGFMASGSTEALNRIKAAAEALNLSVPSPSEVNGRPALIILFVDSAVTPEQALELIRRIREGDLSQDGIVRVDVDLQVMPVDVLRNCRR